MGARRAGETEGSVGPHFVAKPHMRSPTLAPIACFQPRMYRRGRGTGEQVPTFSSRGSAYPPSGGPSENTPPVDSAPYGSPSCPLLPRGDASEKDYRPARSCDDRSDLRHCDRRFCPGAGVAGYRAAASRWSARAEQRPDISSAGYFGQPNPFSPAEGFNDQSGDSTEQRRVAPPASASI